MLRFTKALVRRPCQNMVHGLSAAALGRPDPVRAQEQHAAYVEALQGCGLAVTTLEADEKFPDSVFVEDTAVVCEGMAIITRPGAPSRRGEEEAVALALRRFYPELEAILPPGTLEGGDVMRAGNRFFIGVSARSNEEGARQFAALVSRCGFEAIPVPLGEVLHLKTGVSYLENNLLLAAGEFLSRSHKGTPPQGGGPLLFSSFDIIPVPAGEEYAANSLWVNGRVLVPAGYAQTRKAIEAAGYETVPLDVSEFRKLDGGLSCLSLRF